MEVHIYTEKCFQKYPLQKTIGFTGDRTHAIGDGFNPQRKHLFFAYKNGGGGFYKIEFLSHFLL